MRVLLTIVCLLVFLIVGCTPFHQLYEVRDVPDGQERVLEKKPVPIEFFGKELQTLDLQGEAFNTVGGWYDQESILYIIDSGSGSEIYRYNIFSGVKEFFYSTSSRLLSVKANEDYSRFLLHTSNARNMAEIIVIDQKGNKVFDWQIESYDLDYVWNPYQPDLIFVTTFLEDWSFRTYLVNTKTGKIDEANISQPFIQWLDETTVAYMSWDDSQPNFEAPLYSYNLETNQENLLFNGIISFSTFSNVLLTIDLDHEQESYSFYRFNKSGTSEKLFEHKLPLLSNYSSWFIPYHAYNPTLKEFYTFRPYHTGDYDTYREQFELISYSLNDGKEKSILNDIGSLPINFSPNGYYGLYGFQYEMVIDIKTKRIMPLIKL